MSCLLGCAGTDKQRLKARSAQQAAHYNVVLGMSYLKQSKREKAQIKLQKAKKQAPNDPLVIDAMAYFHERSGQIKHAEKLYKQALQSQSDTASAANNYGTFLCRQGRPQKAMKYFQKAWNQPQYRHRAQAYENAGVCAKRNNDGQKAKRYFEKALKIQPNRPTTLLQLVDLSYNNNNYQQAKKYWHRAHDLVPNNKQVKAWSKTFNAD